MFRKISALILVLGISMAVGDNTYEVKYITVPLDHYTFAREESFKLKYLVNDSHWDSAEGPIFMYAGNEGSIESFASSAGFVWEAAKEFRAKVVFAEHRYYGESLPFGNKSSENENLGYLTASQAIGDFAKLINLLQDNRIEAKYPVILFGGSYGGMLAAYLRIKYPHLVDGAIASSAPVHMFPGMVPCSDYYKIVTQNYRDADPKCEQNIKRSWPILRAFTKSSDNYAALRDQWNLCDPIANAQDADTLITYVKAVYETLAAVNYPFETGTTSKTPAEPVKYVCQFITNATTDGDLIKGVGQVLNTFVNYGGNNQCIAYKDGIEGGTYAPGAWGYQRCTEIVLPTCSTGKEDMFEPNPWNLTDFSANCLRKYGQETHPDHARVEFGGDRLRAASNIVFSNGLKDPWSAGGIFNDINGSVVAVKIANAAHHQELMASRADDSRAVTRARTVHKRNIRRWLREFKTQANRPRGLDANPNDQYINSDN